MILVDSCVLIPTAAVLAAQAVVRYKTYFPAVMLITPDHVD